MNMPKLSLSDWTSIGVIASLLASFSIWSTQVYVTQERFGVFEERFGVFEERFDTFEKRFDDFLQRFDAFAQEVREDRREVRADIQTINTRIDKTNTRIDKILLRLPADETNHASRPGLESPTNTFSHTPTHLANP